MARIRDIKPEFFLDEDLANLPFVARLLFVGLWTLADREGRMEDRPARIKAQVFPYDPDVDADALLDKLEDGGFLVRYEAQGRGYIQIRSFTRHQHPHPKEAPSAIPAPPSREKKLLAAAPPLLAAAGETSDADQEVPSGSSPPGSSGSSGSLAPGGGAPARDPSLHVAPDPHYAPGSPTWLVHQLRIAMEEHRETDGFWDPGTFSRMDADELCAGIPDDEPKRSAVIAKLAQRCVDFAKDKTARDTSFRGFRMWLNRVHGPPDQRFLGPKPVEYAQFK